MDAESKVTLEHIPTKIISGYKLPIYGFNKKNFLEGINLKVRSGDVFLTTYPKCGTTWVQYIIWGIMHDAAVPPSNVVDMMSKDIPFLDKYGTKVIDSMPSPRIIKTHLPYALIPKGKGVKYIFVSRNPFDVCVSLYRHINSHNMSMLGAEVTFDVFFTDFLKGEAPFGDFFQHIEEWYQHRNDDNVLFLYFENLKNDPENHILQIAQFMGEERKKKLEDNPDIMKKILEKTSFEYMKKNMYYEFHLKKDVISEAQKLIGIAQNEPPNELMRIKFFNEGGVGSSKAVLTENQWQLLDQAIDQKISNPGLRAKLRIKKVPKNLM